MSDNKQVNVGGDYVEMHGGTGNTGIDKRTTVQQLPPETQAALRELLAMVVELRTQVSPAGAETIDGALPVLRADAAVEPQHRRSALYAVAGIAATAGALGVPIVDGVNKVLELLG
jgi:hypothetical protein